jgi:hypothetical protein
VLDAVRAGGVRDAGGADGGPAVKDAARRAVAEAVARGLARTLTLMPRSEPYATRERSTGTAFGTSAYIRVRGLHRSGACHLNRWGRNATAHT